MPSKDDEQRIILQALTDEVKSKILDKILAELRADLGLGRAGGYTKSDSGIYGKYQKADVDLTGILEAVKSQMDAMLAEYQLSGAVPTAGDEAPKSE
jgi:hypothetical protein